MSDIFEVLRESFRMSDFYAEIIEEARAEIIEEAGAEIIEEARAEIIEEAIQRVTEKVIQEVLLKTAIEIAENLLLNGANPDLVAKSTELTLGEVKRLQEELIQ